MAVDTTYTWGTGRRKSSVARVRIKPGTGAFIVNNRELDAYFTRSDHLTECLAPMEDTELKGKFDVAVNVHGGGVTGQAGAVRLGLARALVRLDDTLLAALRAGGHTTRDGRMKERKKYGLRGARRAYQFSKR